MKRSLCLLPLSLGTFGLGMTEFVMMGILPDVAKSMNVSIPKAGSFISFYAIGVVVGSVLLILLGRTKPLKNILIVLVSIFIIANTLSAFSDNYYIMCLLRFIAGLPHGAFFGVGSIIAEKLADRGKGTQAVAVMVAGMTIANLAGIPLGTYVSHNFSWRIIFLLVGLGGFIILYYILKLIPYIKALPDTGFIGQFKIFKSLAPWLLILAVIMGNGGIFCWYSYINPLLVQFSGIKPQYVSALMVLAGGGMCVGNLLSGRLSGRYPISFIAGCTQFVACISLIIIFFFSSNPIVSIICMCICTACLFAVSSPQQSLLIRHSKGGELLGASSSQISFNLGNALGAWAGGIPVMYGLSYNYTALPGALFAFIGSVILFYFYKRYKT